jgi:hypothetical protein
MIQLKNIEIYIVEEDIQNILLHMALDKKSFKTHTSPKYTSPCLFN